MKKIILSLFIFILASTNSINAQCDTSFTGATILTLEPGMVGCMVGNFSGAVTVRPGAILKMCGNFTMSGSVNVNDGGSVELTGGSSIAIAGSYSFNGNNALTYVGDPSCLAEMYVTTGVAFVLTGTLTSSNRIHIQGFTVGFGASSGSANIGRPGGILCGLGITSCDPPDPCTAIVPGTISANQTVCEGVATNQLDNVISASGGDGSTYNYQWQISTDGVIFTDIVGQTGLNYSPGVLSATRYYRRAVTSGTCGTDYSNIITITVNPLPANNLVAVNASRCSTGTVNVSVTGAALGTTVDWYADATGGVVLAGGTGTSAFTTPSISSTTTYYTEVRNSTTGCVSSSRIPVVATINPLPSNDLVAVNASRCSTGTVNISVTGAALGTTVDWYADATGGVVLAGGTGTSSFTTPSILSTTTYYAEVRNSTTGCVSSSRIPVVATINPLPANNLVAVNASRCSTGTVNVSVTGAALGTTVDWYADATGGVVLAGGTGTSAFTTPSISSTTTYYAEVRNSTTGCVSSSRIPVVATINPLPSNDLVAVNASRCSTGTVNISVTGAALGTTVDWYADATGGSVLAGGTGTSAFTTPSISSTTTYYAEVRNSTTGCVSSSRIPVVATINPLPANNLVAVNASRCSTGTVNISVTGAALGTTVDWYADATGGSVLAGGTGSISYITPILNTNTITTYYAEVRNSTTGCISSTRIPVIARVDSLPIINLGNDTAICADQNITFNAGAGYPNYLWSTGATTSTINVNTANEYRVTVTDGNGCIGRDTINLAIDSLPIINLGNDTAICADQNITFNAGAGYSNYLWNTGAIISTINVNTANEYRVTVTNGNGCIGRDTINLAIDSLPIINLGNDTAICIDRDIVFRVASIYPNYLWSTNATTDSIVVNTAGQYSVRVTDGNGCIVRDTINLSLDSLPVINLGNDTAICIDRNIVFSVPNIYSDYLWSTSATSNAITVNTAGEYSVRVTNGNGCIGRDTINLSLDSLPIINLGNDTSICIDRNIVFRVANIYPNYLWSNNAIVDSILVNQGGQYSVRVTDGNGCIGRDTINLGIYQLPTPTLLNDTNICRGDSVQIGVQNFYVSYNWRTGQITDSIIINSAATYLVTVVDTNGCVASDSVAIGILELPVVTLGNDTSICIESDYVLNAGNQGVDYLWSTNVTSTTISTTGANTYWVRVVNADGCTTRDTIVVDNHPSPAMTLNIPDTNICLLDTIVLDGGVWTEYQWNYNNSINQTVNVFAAGTYILTVKNQFGCATSDTTVVGIYQLPNSNLGPDREVCLYKDVDITVPELNATYLWSTNENTRTISSNLPGTYSVVVTNINGCSTRDTIELIPGIDLIINLGPDVTICPGVTHGLELFGYDSVRWSTGEITEQIVIANTQRVDVLAVDANGCWGRDTIQITSVPNPTVQLMNDTTICELERQSINIVANATPGVSYLWNTGSSAQSININYIGLFIVEVTDTNNCIAKDTINITPYCRPITITMPNVFTPNNDGVNDYFNPLELTFEDRNYMLLNITQIHFEVFNRWGQKVHGSTEILPNWNGVSDIGGIAPTGTYFWVLEYELINGEQYKKNGYVQLVGN